MLSPNENPKWKSRLSYNGVLGIRGPRKLMACSGGQAVTAITARNRIVLRILFLTCLFLAGLIADDAEHAAFFQFDDA